MRFARTTILAGGAAMLLAGTAAYAADKLHTMNVSLPDGSVAQIEYSGDVAPKVSVVPATVPIAYADPFAELDIRRSSRILDMLTTGEASAGQQIILAVPRARDIPRSCASEAVDSRISR